MRQESIVAFSVLTIMFLAVLSLYFTFDFEDSNVSFERTESKMIFTDGERGFDENGELGGIELLRASGDVPLLFISKGMYDYALRFGSPEILDEISTLLTSIDEKSIARYSGGVDGKMGFLRIYLPGRNSYLNLLSPVDGKTFSSLLEKVESDGDLLSFPAEREYFYNDGKILMKMDGV